jgi:hypothetical protein
MKYAGEMGSVDTIYSTYQVSLRLVEVFKIYWLEVYTERMEIE